MMDVGDNDIKTVHSIMLAAQSFIVTVGDYDYNDNTVLNDG